MVGSGVVVDSTVTKTAEAKISEIKHCVVSISLIEYESLSYGHHDLGPAFYTNNRHHFFFVKRDIPDPYPVEL